MRRKLIVLAAGSAALLGACGVPLDRDAERIPDRELPPDLRAPPSDGPQTTVPAQQASTVQLFFIRGERLVPVDRRVPGPPSLPSVLDHLLAGPAPAEAVDGVRSAINPLARVRRALHADGVATVDLSEPFARVKGEDQIAAVAQVVFSCTAVPGVERVRFLLEGRPVEVPAGDGRLTDSTLSRDDFQDLAPP